MRPLQGEKAIKKRAVSLQGDAEILRSHVISAIPLLFEILPFGCEHLGNSLHGVGHECVGPLHRLARRVHERRLNVGPLGPEMVCVISRKQHGAFAANPIRPLVGCGPIGNGALIGDRTGEIRGTELSTFFNHRRLPSDVL
jgi:hypothetical protein